MFSNSKVTMRYEIYNLSQILFRTLLISKLSCFIHYFIIPLQREKTRYSAVGSAPRSGRGGRAFESPYLDNFHQLLTQISIGQYCQIRRLFSVKVCPVCIISMPKDFRGQSHFQLILLRQMDSSPFFVSMVYSFSERLCL